MEMSGYACERAARNESLSRRWLTLIKKLYLWDKRGGLWRAERCYLPIERSYLSKRRSRRECANRGAVLRGTGCARQTFRSRCRVGSPKKRQRPECATSPPGPDGRSRRAQQYAVGLIKPAGRQARGSTYILFSFLLYGRLDSGSGCASPDGCH
jgi:hypothetical protein